MRIVLLVIILLLTAGCRQAAPTPTADGSAQAAQIAVTIAPQPPTVGDSTLTISVMQQNQPVAGVSVAVRGDMTHAGMRPIIADAVTTDAQGKLVLSFKWSMSGDWIVSVAVTLADNTKLSQDFNVTVKP